MCCALQGSEVVLLAHVVAILPCNVQNGIVTETGRTSSGFDPIKGALGGPRVIFSRPFCL